MKKLNNEFLGKKPTIAEVKNTLHFVMNKLRDKVKEGNNVLSFVSNEMVMGYVDVYIREKNLVGIRIDVLFNRVMHGVYKELNEWGIVISGDNGSVLSSFTVLPKPDEFIEYHLKDDTPVYSPVQGNDNIAFVLAKVNDDEIDYPLLDKEKEYTIAFGRLGRALQYLYGLKLDKEGLKEYRIIPIDMDWFMTEKDASYVLKEMGYLLPTKLLEYVDKNALMIDFFHDTEESSVSGGHVVSELKTYNWKDGSHYTVNEQFIAYADEVVGGKLDDKERALVLNNKDVASVLVERDGDVSTAWYFAYYPSLTSIREGIVKDAFNVMVLGELLHGTYDACVPIALDKALANLTPGTMLYQDVLGTANDLYEIDLKADVNRLGIVRDIGLDGLNSGQLHFNLCNVLKQCKGNFSYGFHKGKVVYWLTNPDMVIDDALVNHAMVRFNGGGVHVEKVDVHSLNESGKTIGVCEYIPDDDRSLFGMVIGHTEINGKMKNIVMVPAIIGNDDIYQFNNGAYYDKHEKGLVIYRTHSMRASFNSPTIIHSESVNRNDLLTCYPIEEVKDRLYQDKEGNYWVMRVEDEKHALLYELINPSKEYV